jgi:hypothetical protein
MPRLARLDAPGVLHHIIICGIERRAIFKDDFNRENFTERLSTLVPETQTSCYAVMTGTIKVDASFTLIFCPGRSFRASLMFFGITT